MLDYNEFDLWLVRHGQSEVNIIPDMIGQPAGSKLTPKGKVQAKLLGARLAKEGHCFDYVYSSDYLRALETCKLVMGSGSRPTLVPELREYSAGKWTGGSRKDIHTTEVLYKMGTLHNAFLPPDGESMHQVERRASKWLEDAILYNQQKMEKAKLFRQQGQGRMNIIAFSHGMTIKCLLHYIVGFDQSFTWKLTLENTSITKLVFREDGWRLITINDHAHLL